MSGSSEYWLLRKGMRELRTKNRFKLMLLFLVGWKVTGKVMFMERGN